MRKIDEKTGWEAARGEVLFTNVVLEAAGVHAKQHRAIHALVVRWSVIDVERRGAEDAIVSAHAHVSWMDRGLDVAVTSFANELLHEAGGKRDDKTFRAYFPDPPNEVVRLGLESEITSCERFDEVRKKVPLSKAAAAKLAVVDAAMEAGRKALAARKAAFGARTGASLEVESWKDDANGARESVYLYLRTYALEHEEERGYADRFFSTATASTKRGASNDAGDDAGGGETGSAKEPSGNKPTE